MSDYTEQAQRYLVSIEGAPRSNYSAWSPGVPGCVATGATLKEVEREMRAAIALHLEGLAEDGEPFPEPSGPAFTSNAILRRRSSSTHPRTPGLDVNRSARLES